jgi:DNA adenine methylase
MCKGIAKPFLKWAGGKGQLLPRFCDFYPNGFDTYIEPFVGGSAVLFDILQKFDIKKAVIIDLNKELINCYRCIKTDVNELIKQLAIVQEKYYLLTDNDRAKFFF